LLEDAVIREANHVATERQNKKRAHEKKKALRKQAKLDRGK
jgi:hypothetical protein